MANQSSNATKHGGIQILVWVLLDIYGSIKGSRFNIN
jgi:hypothetical protein